jgi:hypothetical protein
MGFPLSQKHGWGLSAGLVPFSSIGYKVNSESVNPGGFPVSQVLEGRGGLSKFYGGTGIALFKGISAGINASYIFGQVSSKQTLIIPEEYNKFNFQQERSAYTGGMYFEGGLQYSKSISDKDSADRYRLVLGLTMSPQQGLATTEDFTARSMGVGLIGGGKDTAVHETGHKGEIILPATFKGGLSFEDKDHWMLGADFSYSQWADYRAMGRTDSLRNSFAVSLGGSFTPRTTDGKSYFRRVEYRGGLRFDNGSLIFGGTPVTVYGVSAGLGLPLGRGMSKVNVSFEYFVRGTRENSLIREDYFRVMLGISISDKWFQRYKYD